MRLDFAYEVQPNENGFSIQIEASLDGHLLFRSGATFTSLMEVVDDACIHFYNSVQLLKSAIERT